MDDKGLQICILGAGVVGLTTALKFQELFGNNKMICKIIADKFTEDTTSHGAAGIFRPSTNFMVSSVEVSKQCINESYHYYSNLLEENCGISEISGYILAKGEKSIVRNHYLEKLVPVYREVTKEELNICPGEWKFGSYFTTLLIECKYYLPWAMNKFKANGGIIIKGNINKLSDLEKFGKFDLLINCSGLGSKKIFVDNKIVPMRGQVLKVNAPWLENFYYGDFDTYIIPGSGGIATLGGTRQYESWQMDVCKYDSASIWERCTKLVPKLNGNSEIINEWVGLRPHRDSGVRIEAEIVNGLKVIHNYGHGGYGITTAPGTAVLAVKLANELIKLGTSKL